MTLDFTQPEENVRVAEFGKNKLFLKRKDPFGFVYVSFERGPIPVELAGAFTSFDEARKKVDRYLTEKKKDDSA